MSDDKLKGLLERVHAALEDTRELDDDTRVLVRELDADIHRLIERGAPSEEIEPALERARELHARFQAGHPVVERIVREMIDVLAKVGI